MRARALPAHDGRPPVLRRLGVPRVHGGPRRGAALGGRRALRRQGARGARSSSSRRPELCLYTDGKRPGALDRCDKRGARARAGACCTARSRTTAAARGCPASATAACASCARSTARRSSRRAVRRRASSRDADRHPRQHGRRLRRHQEAREPGVRAAALQREMEERAQQMRAMRAAAARRARARQGATRKRGKRANRNSPRISASAAGLRNAARSAAAAEICAGRRPRPCRGGLDAARVICRGPAHVATIAR